MNRIFGYTVLVGYPAWRLDNSRFETTRNQHGDLPPFGQNFFDFVPKVVFSGRHRHGFGIHMNNRVCGNFWMDNYTITAIPEPRAFALLDGLHALALVWLRRRRAR